MYHGDLLLVLQVINIVIFSDGPKGLNYGALSFAIVFVMVPNDGRDSA